jgi:hypothetical protein
VIVLVTGHVVTVSYVTTVVVAGPPGSDEEPGSTPDGPGTVLIGELSELSVGVFPVGSDEEPGRTPDGPGAVLIGELAELPVGVPPVGAGVGVAGHWVQIVETEVVVTVEAVV